MSSNLYGKVGAEFFGTFFFVLVGAGSAVATAALGVTDLSVLLMIAALANGLGLAIGVTATMAISGGALNPAVALGLLAAKKISVGDFVAYVVAEIAGAIFAVLLLVAALPSSVGNLVHWGSPTLSSSLSVYQGTLLEFAMTAFLVVAVFWTAVSPRAPKVGGFGIGIAVLADVLLGGPFTGAAMNPARAIGPMLAGSFFPEYWYIYWVGPLIAGALVGVFYRYAEKGTP